MGKSRTFLTTVKVVNLLNYLAINNPSAKGIRP